MPANLENSAVDIGLENCSFSFHPKQSQCQRMFKLLLVAQVQQLNWTEVNIVKGSIVVNKTEVNIFLEFPCFLYDPESIGNLISGSSFFSKPSLDSWKFLVHIMLKPNMQDFKNDLISMGDDFNCLTVRTFFSTILLGNWDEDWPFPVLWPLLCLPDLLTYWMQYLDGIILQNFEQLYCNSTTSTSFINSSAS